MNVEPTVGLALLAGFVSFISPCVLPLVPAYVGYMSGHATRAAGESERGKFSTLLHGVFFVLGFTIFFVGFGLITAAASDFLTDLGIDIPTILTRLGGVAVIFFGLYVMKALDPVFRWGLTFAQTLRENSPLALVFSLFAAATIFNYYLWVFEAYEKQNFQSFGLAGVALLLTLALFRKSLQKAESIGDFWYRAIQSLQFALVTDTRNIQTMQTRTGYAGSTGMGIVFAAGWTPCIGPIYGSVLTLASNSAADTGSLFSAGTMLMAYSLGLGVPFLVTALALNQVSGIMTGLKRNMRKVEYASGILLIFIGIFILTGSLESLSARFGSSGDLGDLSVRLEACTVGTANGRIQRSSWWGCVTEGTPKLEDTIVFAAAKSTASLLTDLPAASLDDGNSGSFAPPPPTSTSEPEIEDPLFTVDPDFDPESVEEGITVGKRAPDFTTVTPDGETVSLSDLRGKIVLLNFWATWCGPCRVEMPEFQRIYDEYKDRGFTVLAVDFLESPEQVQEFMDELGISLPIGMDESGEINDAYHIRQYPTSYVIDGHGIIVAQHAGIFSGSQLLEVLESYENGG